MILEIERREHSLYVSSFYNYLNLLLKHLKILLPLSDFCGDLKKLDQNLTIGGRFICPLRGSIFLNNNDLIRLFISMIYSVEWRFPHSI